MGADTDIIKKYFKKSLAGTKGPVIGWMCTYAPVELMHAAGFMPRRIYGIEDFKKADGYLPINFCPYLKSSLAQLLKEKDILACAAFANSCDGSRRLFDMSREYLARMPAYIIDVPRSVSVASVDFYKKSIKKFFYFLKDTKGGKAGEEDILVSIDLFNRIRKSLGDLKILSVQGRLSFIDYCKVVRCSAVSDPALFIEELNRLLEALSSNDSRQKDGARLMLVGNFINEDRLFKILSELDINIVDDDLCTTKRYYDNKVVLEKEDVFYSLAKSYLGKPACMRMSDMGAKVRTIKEAASAKDISAIIFASLKFCDNTLYFYPLLKEELDIPILNIELEYNNFSEGQVKTRIEAFLEMIW